jgi:hypothetical protein
MILRNGKFSGKILRKIFHLTSLSMSNGKHSNQHTIQETTSHLTRLQITENTLISRVILFKTSSVLLLEDNASRAVLLSCYQHYARRQDVIPSVARHISTQYIAVLQVARRGSRESLANFWISIRTLCSRYRKYGDSNGTSSIRTSIHLARPKYRWNHHWSEQAVDIHTICTSHYCAGKYSLLAREPC